MHVSNKIQHDIYIRIYEFYNYRYAFIYVEYKILQETKNN